MKLISYDDRRVAIVFRNFSKSLTASKHRTKLVALMVDPDLERWKRKVRFLGGKS